MDAEKYIAGGGGRKIRSQNTTLLLLMSMTRDVINPFNIFACSTIMRSSVTYGAWLLLTDQYRNALSVCESNGECSVKRDRYRNLGNSFTLNSVLTRIINSVFKYNHDTSNDTLTQLRRQRHTCHVPAP